MYVVMIASECAPVAKVGGLADVVFGLSRELEIRG
ncbi:MAG: starch synthase, partial [Pseudomonadota bacterium]|nr:starch synthase [Pseudomonadota bacterium]